MKTVVAIIIWLLVVSCQTKLKEGIVIEKLYYAETTQFYVISVKPLMTNTRVLPERYVFKVKGFNGKDTVIQYIDVYTETFYKTNVGDYIKIK